MFLEAMSWADKERDIGNHQPSCDLITAKDPGFKDSGDSVLKKRF